jgi:hypothetical protein
MLVIHGENEAYIELLCGHLRRLTKRLRAIPPEKWEWQPCPAAPSPRILAQHAWLWLVSDRNHVHQPDALLHPPISEPPTAQAELCSLLEQETEEWNTLLHEMTPARRDEARLAFNWRAVNVRWLVYHMCQNVIYKHGQLAALYFQLGLDGEEPYQAPFPQNDYDRLAEMMCHPAIHWLLTSDPTEGVPPAVQAAVDERDATGCTALHYAAWRGDADKTRLLLEAGAEVDSTYGQGGTALIDAAWLGHLETVRVLLAHGANTTLQLTSGYTALSLALLEGHTAVAEAIQQAGQ